MTTTELLQKLLIAEVSQQIEESLSLYLRKLCAG